MSSVICSEIEKAFRFCHSLSPCWSVPLIVDLILPSLRPLQLNNSYYPSIFLEKKGIMWYRSPSVRPSVRKQFTSISSYTIDARITKPICMIPLCIQMVAMYLKFFYTFQFWNNSDFSDFTQKCNFSGHFSRNWFKFFKCMGESHIHHISNGFYHVTSRSSPKMEI